MPAEHWHHDAHTDEVTHHRHLGAEQHAATAELEAGTEAVSTSFLTPAYLAARTLSAPAPVAIRTAVVVAVPPTDAAPVQSPCDPRAAHDPPLIQRSPRAPPSSSPALS